MPPPGRTVRLYLWPQSFAVARLRGVPDLDLGQLDPGGPPVCLVVGHGEVSLIAPEEIVERQRLLVETSSPGWRALSFDAELPLETVGLLAAASRVLADVEVPVMAVATHDTDHLLVPGSKLGRALAALQQADLERFL